MSVREYVGARYVPIVVGEWDGTRTYEPLMVVTYHGNSYTSRQYVPAGIEITNESYWVLSANYNAQIEAYRNELYSILPYDESPTEGSTKGVTSDGINKAIASETTRARTAETALGTRIDTAETTLGTRIDTVETTLGTRIDTVDTNIDRLDAQMEATTGSELLTRITNETTNRSKADSDLEKSLTSLTSLVNSKFPVPSSEIEDGAITAPKLAQSAVASVLQGLTIRRFDSSDSSADNDGIVVPSSNTVLAGFYVEELALLVITRCGGSDAWPNDSNTIKLPNYVPSVTSTVNCGDFTYMVWGNSNNFMDWSSMMLYPNGYLRPKSSVTSSHVLPGSVIVYLRPYITNTVSTNATYSDLVTQNGVI